MSHKQKNVAATKKFIQVLAVFACVAAGTGIAWLCNFRSLIGIDDANIYFVYMRNFAQGHGFVYNIGGERVEGFTSLLWTLVGSLFFSISNYPEQLLLLTNIIAITYALWKLLCYADTYFNDNRLISPTSVILLGLSAVIPGYFEWTALSLLETGLWSSLLILITLNVLKDISDYADSRWNTAKFNILLVLIILCRPESIVWGIFFLLSKAWQLFRSNNPKRHATYLISTSIFVYCISLLLLTMWRIDYFGFPFPNTYYAKVSSNTIQNIARGVKYLFLYFTNNPLSVIVFSLSSVFLYRIFNSKQYNQSYNILIFIGVAATTFIIPLHSGGDHFSYSRFMQPTAPLMFVCLMMLLRYFHFPFIYAYSVIVVFFSAFIPTSTIFQNLIAQSSPLAHEWSHAVKGRFEAEMLNIFFDKTSKYPTQGVIAAGGRAFSYKGNTNDLLGLNNVQMAHSAGRKKSVKNHESFDESVFLKQNPDLLWYGSSIIYLSEKKETTKILIGDFEKAVLYSIEKNVVFQQQYSGVEITKKNSDYIIATFASNHFLQQLDTSVYNYRIIPIEYFESPNSIGYNNFR